MTHTVVWDHVYDYLNRAGVPNPSDIGCGGDELGIYHISFTTEQAITFDLLDRLAHIFQTKKIDFTSHHESSVWYGCESACGHSSRDWHGINIYQARVDDMPAIPEPPKPIWETVPEPPRVYWHEFLCKTHLDEIIADFPGWWVRDTGGQCNVFGCNKKAIAVFAHETEHGG